MRKSASIASVRYSPMLWTMVALIAIGTAFLIQENLSALTNVGLSQSLITLAAWLSFGFVGILVLISVQRFGNRPQWTIIVALTWGALAAGSLSQQANIAISTIFVRLWSSSGVTAWLTTPIVEETLKLLGVMALVVIPTAKIRGSLDGLFFGVLVGIGFLICESFFYTIGAVWNNLGSFWGTLFGMIVLRGLLGGIMTHPIFTGLIGAGIGYVVAHNEKALLARASVLASSVAFSIALHSLYNYQDTFNIYSVIIGVTGFVVLLIVLFRARHEEERRLVGIAADYADAGVLTSGDLQALKDKTGRKGKLSKYSKAVLRYVRAIDMSGEDSQATKRVAERLKKERETKD